MTSEALPVRSTLPAKLTEAGCCPGKTAEVDDRARPGVIARPSTLL